MELDIKEHEAIRQYLLGQVPPEDLPQLEERLLTDGAFYEELLIVEDELIDQYFSGELSPPERQSFETHFLLTPDRQLKVRFGQALNKYVSVAGAAHSVEDLTPEKSSEGAIDVAKPPPKKPFFSLLPIRNPILSYSLAAAVVLVVCGVSWVVLRNWRNPAPYEPGKVLTVVLTPGLTRGDGEIKRITLNPDTGTVQLRLNLMRGDLTSYRVTVLLDGRSPIWTRDNIPARNDAGTKAIVADIPAKSLTPGDYQVKVSGHLTEGSFEDIASYRFHVVR